MVRCPFPLVQGLRRAECGGRGRFTFDRLVGRCDDVITYGELFSPVPLADLISRRCAEARWFAFNPGNELFLVVEGTEPGDFRRDLRDLHPLHTRLTDLGLVDPPEVRFVAAFDAFAARAHLPHARRGKDVRHVVRRSLDPGWIPAGER